MSLEEVRFLKSYDRFLDGKDLRGLDWEHVEGFVKPRHKLELFGLRTRGARARVALERLWEYGTN